MRNIPLDSGNFEMNQPALRDLHFDLTRIPNNKISVFSILGSRPCAQILYSADRKPITGTPGILRVER